MSMSEHETRLELLWAQLTDHEKRQVEQFLNTDYDLEERDLTAAARVYVREYSNCDDC